MTKKTGVNSQKAGGRHLKKRVRAILTSMELDAALDELYQLPARQVINPLFSFLYQGDDHLRWTAIIVMGGMVARLADEDMEAARVIIRRLMWNLNDESGGIGWGSPEAMGEILACHEDLAEEYAHILISYAKKDGNYLEYDMLQRGLLWGIARLSQVRPDLVRDAVLHIVPYLESEDPAVRGMSACIMGLLKVREAGRALELLKDDDAEFQTWVDHRLVKRQVKEMAVTALRSLSPQENNGSNRKGGFP